MFFSTIQSTQSVKLKAGSRMIPVTITKEGERLFFKFAFNKPLMTEIKMMQGHRWHGYDERNPRKVWSVLDCDRNRFQLSYLAHPGKDDPLNPYRHYDAPLLQELPRRGVRGDGGGVFRLHQLDMFRHWVTRHYGELAAEMGTGKTLVAIEGIEWAAHHLGMTDWVYVAPKSALVSVRLEFSLWQARVIPRFVTYEGLKKLLAEWPEGKDAPHGVVYDEASRLKNPAAQRTVAAKYLADQIRAKWGDRGFVIEMTGSPAPKSPADWWSQCEVACPGFLKEGTLEKFKNTLAIIEQREAFAGGGAYPHLVGWRDDERKCNVCGLPEDAETHSSGVDVFEQTQHNHKFEPSVNEVARLHRRLQGLVMVKFKRDCFSGDTLVLTRYGPRTLSELASIGHTELYVMTDRGMQWIDCPIKSFGVKRTYQLTFGDHNKVRSTLHHEWLYQSKGIIQQRKLFTFEIKEGKTELPLAPVVLEAPDKEGYAHGFVYGDGTKQNQNHTKVELFGSDADLKSTLLKFGTLSYIKRKGWASYNDVVASFPLMWKELPAHDCTPQYALGFVLGLVAADGCVDEHLRIYQADEVVLKKIGLLAIYAGLRVSPIRMARELSPFDGSYKPLYYFSIQTYNIKPEWILRRDHRSKLKVRGRSSCTTVTDIDWQSGRDEETFCAIVPRWHNFTLANGVITGNCLDLPDKQYREIELKPSRSILNAAEAILAKAPSQLVANILLRELSDGFQYVETEDGVMDCPLCHGARTCDESYDESDPDYVVDPQEFAEGCRITVCEDGSFERGAPLKLAVRQVACHYCDATGQISRTRREARQIPTPKEGALRDLLDQHDEIGRLVVYAGFTGSIDRVAQIVKAQQWQVIRVDGRGWVTTTPHRKAEEMVKAFQDKRRAIPRIAFVGHPGSAGMGLTLTESPTICYWSNDFNAESRIQSEDRIHRMGMDVNRGATIVDLLHLPTDRRVLSNLKQKRKLQDITMGEMRSIIEQALREAS